MTWDRAAFAAAVPPLNGTLNVAGLRAPVTVYRDEWGIPHVRAGNALDAHFATGFVHAQDRLFQMELTWRRGVGRAAEWLGEPAVASDLLSRRLDVAGASRSDADAAGEVAASMLDAYARGVNAFIERGEFPIEYALLDATPVQWAPWHSVAVMRRLGLLMGSVWFKLWRAAALPIVGAEAVGTLRYDDGGGDTLCMPTGAETGRMAADLAVLRPAIEALLAAAAPDATGGGSNNWAIGPGRSATGRPILAGDPHRVFEMPGLYAQTHVACDAWDAIGLTVPGVPGFPHFMHNGHVACCVTHAFVDIHDLYLERFRGGGGEVLTTSGWVPAHRRVEVVHVRDGQPHRVTVTSTKHGPVIVGDPASGHGLSLRSMQLEPLDRTFDCLPRMLAARDVTALFEASRGWGLIDHNLVAADTSGRIGHLVRASVPRRVRANGWLPVPGWTGMGEWRGIIPFDAMPRSIDPPEGVIVTANNRVVADGEPYLCTDCHPPYRAERILRLIEAGPAFRAEDAATVHADTLSPHAALFCALLERTPASGAADALRRELLEWDWRMEASSITAGRYNAWRRALTAGLVRASGLSAIDPAGAVPPGISAAGQLWWTLPGLLRAGDTGLLGGRSWVELAGEALIEAAGAPERPWGELHQPRFTHALSAQFPDLAPLLDAPSRPVGGDGDTVMAVGLVPAAGPVASYGALCRYAFDVGAWANSRWAVFAGASAHPGSEHYADQNGAWSDCAMVPMRYGWAEIEASAETAQTLRPG